MLDLKKEPCANCTFIADIADARVLQHAYIVLDEKLLKGAFAHTTTLPGVLQYSGLFGHTPLRLISPEEPLLIKIEIDSQPGNAPCNCACVRQAGYSSLRRPSLSTRSSSTCAHFSFLTIPLAENRS